MRRELLVRTEEIRERSVRKDLHRGVGVPPEGTEDPVRTEETELPREQETVREETTEMEEDRARKEADATSTLVVRDHARAAEPGAREEEIPGVMTP